MKQHQIEIRFFEYSRLEELNDRQIELVNRALEAAGKAYAPYSAFHVGSAARLGNGEIITGNNQENAAYPSGLCAERVAIFYAGSNHPGEKVTSLAVTALINGSVQDEPVTPCGGCRQVLLEKETRDSHPMELILYGRKKILVLQRASDLLPLPFNLNTGKISHLG